MLDGSTHAPVILHGVKLFVRRSQFDLPHRDPEQSRTGHRQPCLRQAQARSEFGELSRTVGGVSNGLTVRLEWLVNKGTDPILSQDRIQR